MKLSVFILVILAVGILSGTASGYLISFEAPSWVSAGEPIPAPFAGLLGVALCAAYCGARGMGEGQL